MRQFILTIGTLAAVLVSCWEIFQGISAIIRNELGDSLLHFFILTPIALSMVVTFDHINTHLHSDFRRLKKSLARSKGTQHDILHPSSPEVRDTPWEDDSSHIQ